MSRIDGLFHGHPSSCHWPSRYAMEAQVPVLIQEQRTFEHHLTCLNITTALLVDIETSIT